MTSKIVGLFQQDLDEVFAYHTTLRIVLNSKIIGGIFKALQLLFLIYFFFIVFFLEDGYFYSEISDGITLLHASASGTSLIDQTEPGVWDSIDVSNAYMEDNSVFIAVKNVQQYKQKIDNCADFYRECTVNSDCITLVGETCKEGYCFGPNWCGDDANTQTVEYYVPDRYLVWIKSQAGFRSIKSDTGFNTISKETSIMYPKKNANTYSVGQLLNSADVLYKEIREEGAIIKVNVYWDCYANSEDCSPSITAHRIDKFSEDESLGAYQVKYNYFKQGGVTYRNCFNMTGIRFIFETKATAKVFSFNNLVLQVGTLIAFLRALYYFFDFVIYNWLPGFNNFKREKYTEYDDRRSDEEEEDMEKDDKKRKETEVEREHSSDHERRHHHSSDEDDEYAGGSGAESDDLLNDEKD